jgi:TorA-specific chaperone
MNEITTAQIAANRAALYRWFALAFFAPPAEGDVVDMREGKVQRLLHALAATPGASLGVQAMGDVLTSGTPAEVASTLGAAHAKLFYGVGGHETASPYRSVYSSERGVMCQQATAEMERVLRQHRLRLEDKVCEPSDHLSIQLETMAQLALRYVESASSNSSALASLQSEQAEFLNTQLLSWLPAFSRRVVEVDDLGFHAGLASALQAVLEQDHAYLVEA